MSATASSSVRRVSYLHFHCSQYELPPPLRSVRHVRYPVLLSSPCRILASLLFTMPPTSSSIRLVIYYHLHSPPYELPPPPILCSLDLNLRFLPYDLSPLPLFAMSSTPISVARHVSCFHLYCPPCHLSPNCTFVIYFLLHCPPH